jgi:two-component system sensor histidine kinase KdpD
MHLSESLIAIDRLEDIVENLLSMNRLDSGILKLKKTSNNLLDLASVVADARRRKSRDHPLSISVDKEVPLVSFDFNLMAQALTNIPLNVAMHTAAGTPVECSVQREGHAICLTFADQVPEVLPNLFGRFFRGENAAKGGVGLGLSICKGIVEAHGGSFSASQNREGGLFISLFLPACLAAEQRRDAS